MPKVTFSTKVEGPFFTLKGQPLKDAGAELIQDLLKEGEAKVEAELRTGHGVRTGEFKSTIVSKFTRSSAHAVGWGSINGGKEYPNSVKGKWLEGVTRRNESTRFKGYAMFRKATQHLNRVAREMAGKRYKRAVERLT